MPVWQWRFSELTVDDVGVFRENLRWSTYKECGDARFTPFGHVITDLFDGANKCNIFHH
jgi:hypothetical protein